jgi:hypothetical protein
MRDYGNVRHESAFRANRFYRQESPTKTKARTLRSGLLIPRCSLRCRKASKNCY